MDNNKYQPVSTDIKQQQQEKLSEQGNDENFTQPAAPPSPKVTVSLPKHVASRLLELVQKRDNALLRLGIISVQFENDQIIPLTLGTTNSMQAIQEAAINSTDPIIEVASIDICNPNCISNLNVPITTLSGLNSPGSPMLEESEDMNTSDLPMLDSATVPISKTTTEQEPSLGTTKIESNRSKLCGVYNDGEDDDDDDKEEEEAVNEVGNQHSSYNIHQLSQLEFADSIELDMYDNENLLFPDYTLNLS